MNLDIDNILYFILFLYMLFLLVNLCRMFYSQKKLRAIIEVCKNITNEWNKENPFELNEYELLLNKFVKYSKYLPKDKVSTGLINILEYPSMRDLELELKLEYIYKASECSKYLIKEHYNIIWVLTETLQFPSLVLHYIGLPKKWFSKLLDVIVALATVYGLYETFSDVIIKIINRG